MASHACGVTALYVAGAPPSRLRVSAPPGSDRMTRAGKRRQRNAGSIERTLADCCTAARGRDAFAFRVAHSIRPEGAAAAGARRARARPHDGWPASRVLLCRLLAEPGALRAVAAVAAPAAAALASGVDLAGWASLPSSPAAACRNLGFAQVLLFVAALRVRPASAGGTSGSLLPPTPPFRRRLRWFEE